MLGSENGIDLVRELRAEGFDGVIVVMTAFGTIESAVSAMRLGADDYLQKPLSMEELSLQVGRWLEHRTVERRLHLYERIEKTREQTQDMIGDSPAWKNALSLATRLARMPLGDRDHEHIGSLPTILLLGETGVGKGILARHIHSQAELPPQPESRPGKPRPLAPFVHINCSALPPTLVEGELFGHEKGAFTDAREAKPGLFEMAEGGTIFLDEISEMPPELQAKLLLVVELGTFRRVGGIKERSVRARVIAASNQNLTERARSGSFRRDLLYRLNGFTITIPPLRERGDDSFKIATGSLDRLTRRHGRPGMSFSPAARLAILGHDWPGNVRELVNSVQRAVMLAETNLIQPLDLGLTLGKATPLLAHSNGAPPASVPRQAPPEPEPPPGGLRFDFDKGIHTADEVEKTLLMQALDFTKGNVSRAAKLIGMQRSSLRYRIERYNLDRYVVEVARK